MSTEPRYLDLAGWPRRQTFEYFARYDKPYFNACTRVDVAALRLALDEAGGERSVVLACHYLALRLARRVEPLRYRLEQGRVRVHPSVDASTTVLRHDQSIGFARLRWADEWPAFARQARAVIDGVRSPQAAFTPLDEDTAVMHFTTLPWIHFTSFSHARNWGREDSIPKFAFGRFDSDGARLWMPLSVEVHHALMDGLHLGQFVQAFEAALREPGDWVGARPPGL